MQGRTVPADLFSRLEIDNNRYGINREGWGNMRDRVEEMSECPVALQQVTYLYMDVYVDGYGSMDAGEENMELLAGVLSAMPNLESLHWGVPAEANEFFECVLARRELQLPSVAHLVVGAFAQHMVSVCPRLRSLEGGSYFNHWSWGDGGLEPDEEPLDSSSAGSIARAHHYQPVVHG
ncbi:hypothetical protein K504DRAFT_120956 [Pleomassaria siparia CBS 279.74]|uniref:Uncharacterized protein n=1 Tax=Pleomassaria siparia CBS 279.74 TaxID=1314801 RepID=A0A6G1JWF3_9PLEO|nr:hypothetical protein K504DRAFT_120956 [Pleomassaria siparia CBS 279.74]